MGFRLYRWPRTQHVRRWAQTVEPGEPPARPGRTARGLPKAFDDIWRGDFQIRSWKRHRHHQWKAVR